jgi:uncharacterized membrane protein YcaP (DUF421 family)
MGLGVVSGREDRVWPLPPLAVVLCESVRTSNLSQPTMKSVFFDSWQGILRIAITVPTIYAFIILSVRIVGKRSTSRMNNFDWIVTVAIGAISGTAILDKRTAILEAILATALLFGLQFLITRITLHNRGIRKLIKAKPTLLVYQGEYLDQALDHERISRDEVMAALRSKGLISVYMAEAVILEPDATFSIIERESHRLSNDDLEGVEGFPPDKA